MWEGRVGACRRMSTCNGNAQEPLCSCSCLNAATQFTLKLPLLPELAVLALPSNPSGGAQLQKDSMSMELFCLLQQEPKEVPGCSGGCYSGVDVVTLHCSTCWRPAPQVAYAWQRDTDSAGCRGCTFAHAVTRPLESSRRGSAY